MKRFYKDVSVASADGGFRVLLDGRPVRTRGGVPQIMPTRALAEAIADEWRRQGEEIDAGDFVLRDLADLAIDQVRSARVATIAGLLAFGETDTLCYRADPDEPLFHRQQEVWEPLLTACEAANGIRLERTSGIVHRRQPAESIARLREQLAGLDDFALAGLQTLTSLAASLSVGLAALHEGADTEALFAAANLEQDWQAEQWGWDHQAEQDRAMRLKAFRLAAAFARLARAT